MARRRNGILPHEEAGEHFEFRERGSAGKYMTDLESMSASFTLEWILTFCSEEEESLFIAHSVQCSSLHLTHPSGALCNQHKDTQGVNSSCKPVR